MPKILTKVIDTVYQYKSKALELYGEEGGEDCKSIAGYLSKYKNIMATDKPFYEITDGRKDQDIWNKYLVEEIKRNDGIWPSSFKSSWLYAECMMYRIINEATALSKHLKAFDPFQVQKQKALLDSESALLTLSTYLQESKKNDTREFKTFADFVQICLWGNKCDLSITAGRDYSEKIDPVEPLELLKSKILVNDLQQVWNYLKQTRDEKGNARVDIILDNAGFELFTDLVLADYLMASGHVTTVHLYHKSMPWFVSDVTSEDFHWTLDFLSSHNDPLLSSLAAVWSKHIADGKWVLQDHIFWTTPHAFCDMKKISPDLYEELGKSNLIFLKGDLNYRKLVQDLEWDHTETYERALGGFHPAPHCTLRTLKGDVVVGMQAGQDQIIAAEDPDWLFDGQYAVIQFSDKVYL